VRGCASCELVETVQEIIPRNRKTRENLTRKRGRGPGKDLNQREQRLKNFCCKFSAKNPRNQLKTLAHERPQMVNESRKGGKEEGEFTEVPPPAEREEGGANHYFKITDLRFEEKMAAKRHQKISRMEQKSKHRSVTCEH